MGRRKGSILVVVMFVLAVFALVALSLCYRAGLERRAVRNRAVTAQLRANVGSAVNISLARLLANTAGYDSLADPAHRHAPLASEGWVPEWTATLDGQPSEFMTDYQVVDEESKLNLLYASSTALKTLGMSDDQIASFFNWVSSAGLTGVQGATDSYYSSLPTPYHCKSNPIEVLDELMLIRSFGASDYLGQSAARGTSSWATGNGAPSQSSSASTLSLGWLDLVTCCGNGSININTVPQGVLQALPLSAGAPSQIIAFRAFDGMSGDTLANHVFKSSADINQLQGLTDSDKALLMQMAIFNAQYFRIFAQSTHLPTGLVVRQEVLVTVSDGQYQILQWKVDP